MEKRYLLFFGLFFSITLAQKPDTATIENNLAKAQQYFDHPKDSLLCYATTVIKNAKDSLSIGLAYHYAGNTYKLNGNLNKALENYTHAYAIFKKLVNENPTHEFKNHLANEMAAMAIVYSQQSDYAKALTNHFKALKIFIATKNQEKTAAVYNNIAIEYQSLNKFTTANEYFLKASKLNDKLLISNGLLYTNIGKNHLKLNQKNTAKTYFDKALENINQEKNPSIKGELFNNLGYYYFLENDFLNAEKYLNEAIIAFGNDTFGLSDTYYYLGLLHQSKKEYSKALTEFGKALQISKELSIKELEAKTAFELSKIYEQKGNYKEALKHQQNFATLNQQITAQNNDKTLALAELNASFEKHKFETEKYKQKQQRNFYLYLLSTLLLVGIIGFMFYRNRQTLIQKNIVLEKDKAEFHHQALYLQMNPHFIFNCLGSISSFILQNENETAITYLNHFARLMRLTLENSKDKYITLEKETESLTQYLELEKLRFDHAFDYKITQTESAEEDMTIPSMLLQPLVENAIIHGIVPRNSKGNIHIHFDTQNNQIAIKITDTGIGYNFSKKLKENSVLSHKSMALEIVKNRIEMLGGTFSINEITENNIILGTEIKILI